MISIPCITLFQPWASLVKIRAKRYETRSWATHYRGPLAIHSAKLFPGYAKDLLFTRPFVDAFLMARHSFASLMYATVDKYDILPLGKILCIVDLTDCQEITPDNIPPEPEQSFGLYTPGRYMWKLENLRVLSEPLPCIGRQRLWTPPENVLEKLQGYL